MWQKTSLDERIMRRGLWRHSRCYNYHRKSAHNGPVCFKCMKAPIMKNGMRGKWWWFPFDVNEGVFRQKSYAILKIKFVACTLCKPVRHFVDNFSAQCRCQKAIPKILIVKKRTATRDSLPPRSAPEDDQKIRSMSSKRCDLHFLPTPSVFSMPDRITSCTLPRLCLFLACTSQLDWSLMEDLAAARRVLTNLLSIRDQIMSKLA